MKPLRVVSVVVVTITVLLGIHFVLHAQTEAQTAQVAMDDVQATLQPMAFGEVPANGGAFFMLSDYLGAGGSLGPPWPFLKDTNATVYSLNGTSFLVDDT